LNPENRSRRKKGRKNVTSILPPQPPPPEPGLIGQSVPFVLTLRRHVCRRLSGERPFRLELSRNTSPDGGFENPADTRTRAFRDTDDSDERFWAALELYLSTQEPVFQEAALALEKKRIPLLSASGYWGNVIPLAIASILQNKTITLDAVLIKTVEADLISLANTLLEILQSDGYRMSIREGEFTWGSNGVLLQTR
jgi:hypothetical protein